MTHNWSKEASSSNNNESALLEIEILDSLKSFIGSEPFEQYLAEYLTNTSRNIDRLGHAIAAEDSERVKQMSHKLKGSAGNIGAMKMSNICSRIQTMAVDEDLQESMCQHFFELQNVFEETQLALNDYIQQLEQIRQRFA